MQLKDFDRLTRKDFENGAVIDEIRTIFKQYYNLLAACKMFIEAVENPSRDQWKKLRQAFEAAKIAVAQTK